ncbi:MAG: XrtA/PEP-CTERM system TPR-repeat protein PrsT [Betaproteobacteria bacterium]
MIPSNSRQLALAAMVLVLVGCKSERSDDFVASGRAFLDKRDYPAAIIQFKNAVQKDSGSGEARYGLGVALRQLGDNAAAEIEFRKAQASGFDPESLMPELMAVLLETGQFDKVIAEGEKAILKTPLARGAVLAAVGTAYVVNGKLDDARRLAADAVTADPAGPGPQLLRARLAVIDQKVDEAQQILADALAKSPNDYETLRFKGDLDLAQGKPKEAIQLYDRAIAARPSGQVVYLSLVPTLLRQRDLEGATARLAALKKSAGGTTGTRYLEALVAFAKGDRKLARDAIRQVLKTGTDYPPALLLAGNIEHDLGNFVLAEDLLTKVATGVPTDVQSRRLLTSAYLRSGQIPKAKEVLAALIKLDPDSIQTNTLAGQVAAASGDPTKASEYFKKAVAIDPKNTVSRTMLGASNMLRGEIQRGLSDLEAASAADSSHIEADVSLIQYFLSQKQFDKAAQAVDALAKKQPENPMTFTLRGGVLLAKGDQAGARKAFEEALARQPTFLPAASNLAALDLRDKKPKEAINRYREVLAKDPKQIDAALLLASLLQSQGNTEEVDQVIANAVAADPSNVSARLAQIGHLQQSGRKKEALEAAQKAIAAVPDDPRLLRVLGLALSANGDYSQAASTLGKLSALEPRNTEALALQANAYAAGKDFVSARGTLGKAIEIQPENALLRAALVDLGITEKHFDAALNDARTIQKKWPKNSAGYIAESMVLSNQQKEQEAESVLRNALRNVDDPGVAVQLFKLLVKSKGPAEADKFVAEWMASRPKDAALATVAAESSLSRDDFATAVHWYRAALKARPDNPTLLNNLAWSLGQIKDPQALATAERAQSLAPSNAAIIDTLGWLQLQKGDAATAVTTLQRAVGLAPGAPSIRINLAKALIATGRKDDARAQLQATAAMNTPKSIADEVEKLLASL